MLSLKQDGILGARNVVRIVERFAYPYKNVTGKNEQLQRPKGLENSTLITEYELLKHNLKVSHAVLTSLRYV